MAPRNQQEEMIFQNKIISMTHERNVWAAVLNPARFNQRIAGNKGFPDLMMVGPGGILFRELKTMNGMSAGLRTDQQQWRDRLKAAGQDFEIWTPRDLETGRIEQEMSAIEVPNEHSDKWSLVQLGIPAAPPRDEPAGEDADDSGAVGRPAPASVLAQLAEIGAYLFTSARKRAVAQERDV